MKLKISILVFLQLPLVFYAQSNKACVNQMLSIQAENSIKKFNDDGTAFFVNYSVTTTDWEDQTIVSNVKIYKAKDNMHFFSEQGLIFQDAKEAFVVLPTQRLIIINTVKEELNNMSYGDDFLQFKKDFIDSCEVVRCDSSSQNTAVKILELKVNNDLEGRLHVKKAIYKYNTETKKMMTTSIAYNKDYKVRRVEMTFNEVNHNLPYKFKRARKYVFDSNGKLLAKYKGFEVADNREKAKK